MANSYEKLTFGLEKTLGITIICEICDFISRAPSVSCATRLKLSICLFFLSGNIFRTAEPISTKVCTVTATGQE